jgi:hypothetical protein
VNCALLPKIVVCCYIGLITTKVIATEHFSAYLDDHIFYLILFVVADIFLAYVIFVTVWQRRKHKKAEKEGIEFRKGEGRATKCLAPASRAKCIVSCRYRIRRICHENPLCFSGVAI